MSSTYGVFLGLDVGKGEHHAADLNPAGKRRGHAGPRRGHLWSYPLAGRQSLHASGYDQRWQHHQSQVGYDSMAVATGRTVADVSPGALVFCPADRGYLTTTVLDVEGGDVLSTPRTCGD